MHDLTYESVLGEAVQFYIQSASVDLAEQAAKSWDMKLTDYERELATARASLLRRKLSLLGVDFEAVAPRSVLVRMSSTRRDGEEGNSASSS
jgi:hypothetical protein